MHECEYLFINITSAYSCYALVILSESVSNISVALLNLQKKYIKILLSLHRESKLAGDFFFAFNSPWGQRRENQ